MRPPIGWLAAAALALLLGTPARAGVPRSCVHPRYDPVACARETRREHRDVLPLARIRELERQRPRLLRVAPRQDQRRNRLLRQIRDELQDAALHEAFER